MPSLTKDVSAVGTRDPYVPTNQDDPPYLFPPKVGQGRDKGDHSEWVMTQRGSIRGQVIGGEGIEVGHPGWVKI